jgi:hypothetical protein
MSWFRRNWRGLLARLPLPTLALAASYGVGSFAALFVPTIIAIIQAAAFELTYIGLAIIEVPEAARRRRATMISVSAVAVSVVYNSAAGYFHRNPGALIGLSFPEELGLAIAHGAPLAIVAYLVADLLLHTRPRDLTRLRAQRRALVRRLIGVVRTARTLLDAATADLAQARAQLAQLQATAAQPDPLLAQQATEIAQLREQAAQAEWAAAQLTRETAERLRKQEQEIARLKEEAAQPLVINDFDVTALAQRLRDRGITTRDAAQLIGMPESTLRSRLGKAAQNGHEVLS